MYDIMKSQVAHMLQGPHPAPLGQQWQQCGFGCALLNCWPHLPGSQTPVWRLPQWLHLFLHMPNSMSIGAVAPVQPASSQLVQCQHTELEECALRESPRHHGPCKVPCKSLAVLLIKEDAVGVSCRLLWLSLWLWNGACKAEPTMSTPATPAPTGCSCQHNSKLIVLSNKQTRTQACTTKKPAGLKRHVCKHLWVTKYIR